VSSYWYEGRILTRDKRMQRLDDDPPARGPVSFREFVMGMVRRYKKVRRP
jgi:hypothetical protein